MTVKQTIAGPWVLSLAVVFCLSGPVPGQDSEAARRFAEAQEILLSWGYTSGYAAYLKVADDFPGTWYGAESLMTAYQWADPPHDLELMQRVVSEYAGTRWEMAARVEIIALENRGDIAAEIAALDQLAQSLGGPSLARVLAGDGPLFASQIFASPRRLQGDLYVVYQSLWLTMAQQYGQYREALQLALFLRETFSPLGVKSGSGVSEIRMSLGLESGTSYEPANIVLSVDSPSEGATVQPQPTITAQIVGGDFDELGVDLAKLAVTLDGQDIKSQVAIHCEIDRTPQPGEVFETITLTFTPEQPLAPGSHSFAVEASTVKPYPKCPVKTETLIRHFVVADTPPPPSTETLPASKDALVYERGPHANEGTNPRLTLEKITGKAARNLLGFELTGVDNNALTRAHLVLTIDPSQQVTGWGNGETVSVKPVTVAWQEGNGKKHGVPGSQQTAGSGAGATWFSPVDENIASYCQIWCMAKILG
jgi:hypothetical protein